MSIRSLICKTNAFIDDRNYPLNERGGLDLKCYDIYLYLKKVIEKDNIMKVHYEITSSETGTVKLRRRKIAKALRWWLRERGISYEHIYYMR